MKVRQQVSLDVMTAISAEMQELKREGTAVAPPEHTWVCGACGKTSRTRYGFDDAEMRTADLGWDESCVIHAVLCETSSLERGPGGLVVHCRAVGASHPNREDPPR